MKRISLLLASLLIWTNIVYAEGFIADILEAVSTTFAKHIMKGSQFEVKEETEGRAVVELSKAPSNATETGMLSIKSKKSIELLFINETEKTKYGPYKIDPESTKNIEIKKGIYKIIINDGNKQNITSLSFLENKGNLDL